MSTPQPTLEQPKSNLNSLSAQHQAPLQPDPKAQAYLKSIVAQPTRVNAIPEKTNAKILETIDFVSCTSLSLPYSLLLGFTTFARDVTRYSIAHRFKRISERDMKIPPLQVHSMLFTSHLLRGLYFWPFLAISQQLPYSLNGNPRWTTQEYLLSGAFLGVGYGALTRYRSPVFLTASTLVGAAIGGIYGHLVELNGKPLFQLYPFVGKRRFDDHSARRNIEYLPWYKDHVRI